MITQARLRKLLAYNPKTGLFRWRVAKSRCIKVGQIAGTLHSGGIYWQIAIDGRAYLAHRLAWLYVYGYMPLELDHKNGHSDAIANLRLCTSVQNHGNTRKQRRNTSGYKGVSFDKSRSKYRVYVGRVYVGRQFIGRFDTVKEAASVYATKAREYFGEFACP